MTVEAASAPAIETKEFQTTVRRLTKDALLLAIATFILAATVLYFLKPRGQSVYGDISIVAVLSVAAAITPLVLVCLQNRGRAGLKYTFTPEGVELVFGVRRIPIVWADIRKISVRSGPNDTDAFVTLVTTERSWRIAPQDHARFVDELSAKSGVAAEKHTRAGWRSRGVHKHVVVFLFALCLVWSAARSGPFAAAGMVIAGLAVAAALAKRRWWEPPSEGKSNPRRLAGLVIGLALILFGVAKYIDWRESPTAAIDLSSWSSVRPSPYLESDTPDVTLIIPAGWMIGRSTDDLGAWLSARMKDSSGRRVAVVISIPDKRSPIPGLPPGPEAILQECQSAAAGAVAHAVKAYRGGSAPSFTPLGYKEIMGQVWYAFSMPSILKDGPQTVTYWQPTRSTVVAITFEQFETNDPSVWALFKSVKIRR